jgi:YD repeat-containing protein
MARRGGGFGARGSRKHRSGSRSRYKRDRRGRFATVNTAGGGSVRVKAPATRIGRRRNVGTTTTYRGRSLTGRKGKASVTTVSRPRRGGPPRGIRVAHTAAARGAAGRSNRGLRIRGARVKGLERSGRRVYLVPKSGRINPVSRGTATARARTITRSTRSGRPVATRILKQNTIVDLPAR